jgi:hypothetical protein
MTRSGVLSSIAMCSLAARHIGLDDFAVKQGLIQLRRERNASFHFVGSRQQRLQRMLPD